jgi:hypothetical protein
MCSFDAYYIVYEMYVDIRYDCARGKLSVPLTLIEPTFATEKTVEVIGDWHYWLKHGFTF